MALFDDVRLPEEVEKGVVGGPEFKTSIVAMSSGQEQRNVDWSDARGVWDISYGIDNEELFSEVRAFFFARRGRGRGFRFRDWSDYQMEDELIGLGDGSNDEFQIIKTYEGSGPHPYTRIITRPVSATIEVKVNGVATAEWTLQSGGIIKFNVGHEPGDTLEVTCTCDFDVPVRFDSDKFNIQLETALAGSVPTITITEIRE